MTYLGRQLAPLNPSPNRMYTHQISDLQSRLAMLKSSYEIVTCVIYTRINLYPSSRKWPNFTESTAGMAVLFNCLEVLK